MENKEFCAYQPLEDALYFLKTELVGVDLFNPSSEDRLFINAHRELFALVDYLRKE